MPAYFEPKDGDFQKLTEQLVNSSSTSNALKQSAFNQISLEQASYKVAQNISSVVNELRQENQPNFTPQTAAPKAVQKTADFSQSLNNSRPSNTPNAVNRLNSSQSHTTKSVRRTFKAADTAHALHQRPTSASKTAHRLHTQHNMSSSAGSQFKSMQSASNGEKASFGQNATSRQGGGVKQKRPVGRFQTAWGLFSVSAAASAILMGAGQDILGISFNLQNYLIIFSFVFVFLTSVFRFFNKDK